MMNTTLNSPEVTGVLFHPRHGAFPLDDTTAAVTAELPVAKGVMLSARLYSAGTGTPAILYFHGNAEIAADYDTIAPLYTNMGISLLVIDYRGYGSSTGQPSAAALITDARNCLDGVRNTLAGHGLGHTPLIVMGRSLGSAAAIEVAVTEGERLGGLIIESGFALTWPLIRRLGGAVPPGAAEDQGFGNLRKIRGVRIPTLVIHGEQDTVIPVMDGRTLYENAGTAAKYLVTVPTAGHNDLLVRGQAAYLQAVHRFVAEVSGRQHPARQ